tara:strand:+ start:864 stop:1115 length:252 start_codon:yes stop_codon:yes gene_type:complete
MAKIDSYSTAVPSENDLLLGSDSDAANATKNFTVKSLRDYMITSVVPAAATSTGISGTIAYDASYMYICVAANTWKRVAIAAW